MEPSPWSLTADVWQDINRLYSLLEALGCPGHLYGKGIGAFAVDDADTSAAAVLKLDFPRILQWLYELAR